MQNNCEWTLYTRWSNVNPNKTILETKAFQRRGNTALNQGSVVSETYQMCGMTSLRQLIINAGEGERVRILTNYFGWLHNAKNKPDPHFSTFS